MQPAILILSGALGDTRRYRTFHLYEQMRLAGVDCVLSHLTDTRLPRLARGARVMILHRVPLDGFVERLIGDLHRRGGALLVDCDDLIFDPQAFRWIDSPDFADAVRAALYRETMLRHRRTLELSDGVLASTGYLAERVRALGKPCVVHRNAFSLEMGDLAQAAYRQRRLSGERVVIGYASGTPTHQRDFALVRPALREILQHNPQAELWLAGALAGDAEWGAAAARVRHTPLVPWRELPAVLAQFDINLAPLQTDNPFSQSKSAIKYMEAALVGVATIASPTDAFHSAIRHGQNGLLAADGDQWLTHLQSLVVDAARRQELGEAARREVLTEDSAPRRAAQLAEEWRQLAQAMGRPELERLWPTAPVATPVPGESYLARRFEQHPTLPEMGLYLLKRGEIRRLAGMMWVQLRRLLAPVFPF